MRSESANETSSLAAEKIRTDGKSGEAASPGEPAEGVPAEGVPAEGDPAPNGGPPEDPRPKPRRQWRRELRSWLLMLALIVVFSWALGAWRAPDLGGEAPGFALSSLDGTTVRLADFRGRTVVLNFWATWCPPCRVELPSFARFARNHPDIVVLGLAVDSPVEELRGMVESEGLGYPILLVDAETAARYRVASLPTTFVVDAEGQVQAAHSGIVLGPMLWWMTR